MISSMGVVCLTRLIDADAPAAMNDVLPSSTIELCWEFKALFSDALVLLATVGATCPRFFNLFLVAKLAKRNENEKCYIWMKERKTKIRSTYHSQDKL